MNKIVTANSSLLRQLNRSSIIRAVRAHRELSRAMLARELSLSKPAVSSLVDELIGEGWLVEIGTGDSTGGRKPTMLKLNPRGGGIVGVIYNSYGLEMSIMDFSGATKVESFAVIDDELYGVELLDEICRNVNAFIDVNRRRVDRYLGLGFGIPGAIRQSDGQMLFTPVKGWQGVHIVDELQKRIELPIFVENDSNLMALGEHNAGIGQDVDDMIYINVSSGIGAGIIVNSQLFRGFGEMAGEIGYLMFGKRENAAIGHGGIFEGNYSARTIRKRFFLDKKLKALLPIVPEDNSSLLCQLRNLAEMDKNAREFWEDILRNWAYAVAAMVSVISPQLVVLGGEMPIVGREGIKFMTREIKQILPFNVEMKAAVLGRKSGLLGAAHLVLDSDRALSSIGKNKL
ncbi:MAG: ROK family transcriptional regulator [Negativicutes bacterium]|jgi:predicted NBD/HSP70 family sugar kinase